MIENTDVRKKKVNTILGFCGLLGMIGPIAYYYTKEPFMICFIAFIGFFGFFFENKIPDDRKNEKFLVNENKARIFSTRFALMAIIFCMIISFNISNVKSAYTFLIGAISVIWGLVILVNQYLLYRFMKQE